MLFFRQVAELLLPMGGRPIAEKTVRRWALHGVRSPAGTTVKLRSTRIGRRFGVTRSDLKDFLATVAGREVPLADEAEAVGA